MFPGAVLPWGLVSREVVAATEHTFDQIGYNNIRSGGKWGRGQDPTA